MIRRSSFIMGNYISPEMQAQVEEYRRRQKRNEQYAWRFLWFAVGIIFGCAIITAQVFL